MPPKKITKYFEPDPDSRFNGSFILQSFVDQFEKDAECETQPKKKKKPNKPKESVRKFLLAGKEIVSAESNSRSQSSLINLGTKLRQQQSNFFHCSTQSPGKKPQEENQTNETNNESSHSQTVAPDGIELNTADKNESNLLTASCEITQVAELKEELKLANERANFYQSKYEFLRQKHVKILARLGDYTIQLNEMKSKTAKVAKYSGTNEENMEYVDVIIDEVKSFLFTFTYFFVCLSHYVFFSESVRFQRHAINR